MEHGTLEEAEAKKIFQLLQRGTNNSKATSNKPAAATNNENKKRSSAASSRHNEDEEFNDTGLESGSMWEGQGTMGL